MASFIENMRMNSIYPPNAPPAPNENDLVSQFLTRILPVMHGEQDRTEAFFQKHLAQQRALEQQDAGNAKANPNVVFAGIPGAITPIQNAQLKQNEEKIQETKSRDTGNLKFKQGKEETDSNIRQQRADTYSSMHDLSDADKLDIINRARAGDIKARGIIQRDLLDTKGTQATELEGQRQIGRTGLENQKQTGQQKLADINNTSRMKIEQFKQDNKNWLFKEMPGGNVMAFDPTDPSKVVDTGVSSGKLTDKDKIELGIKGRSDLADKNIQARQHLQDTKPNELKPNQVTVDRYNKAQQLLTENPNYADYIKVDPQTKSFVVTPPSATGFAGFGANPEKDKANLDTFHKINESIYGTSSNTPNESNIDTVDMKDPSGKVGKVPKAKVQDATKAGYSVVK